MAKRKIRFGGPALRKGQRTWYDTIENGGRRQKFAVPGDVVDADSILRILDRNGDGYTTEPNADYYVNCGMASYVEVPKLSKKREAEAS